MEEFTDVNNSEKQLLILWNSFCSSIQGRCGAHLGEILARFIAHHGEQIWRHKLMGNFQLMVHSMVHAGVLDQAASFRVITALHQHILALSADSQAAALPHPIAAQAAVSDTAAAESAAAVSVPATAQTSEPANVIPVPPAASAAAAATDQSDLSILLDAGGEENLQQEEEVEEEAAAARGRQPSAHKSYSSRPSFTSVQRRGTGSLGQGRPLPGLLRKAVPTAATGCPSAECNAATAAAAVRSGSRQHCSTVAGENNNVKRNLTYLSERPMGSPADSSSSRGREGSEDSRDSLILELSDDSEEEIKNFFSAYSSARRAAPVAAAATEPTAAAAPSRRQARAEGPAAVVPPGPVASGRRQPENRLEVMTWDE